MFIDEAIDLAKQHGFALKNSSERFMYDLFSEHGYEDSLHKEQIAEMDEEDFVEFYLK